MTYLEELSRLIEDGRAMLCEVTEISDLHGSIGAHLQAYSYDRDGWEDLRLDPLTKALKVASELRAYDGSAWQRLQVTSATRALKIQIRNADHGLIHTGASLLDDDHTQYLLLAGRAGGQIAHGGTAASGMLVLHGTAHATKGSVRIGAGSWLDVPEVSAPGTPTSGFGSLYAKVDGKLYWKDDAGTEYDLTAGLGVVTSVSGTSPIASSGGATPAISLGVSAGSKFLSSTALNTWTERNITAAGLAILDDAAATDQLTTLGLTANGKSLVTAADYAAMRVLLDLESGTDFLSPAVIAAAYQPLDTDLTAIAALVSAADKLPYATGAGTWALADLPAAGRTFIAATTAAAETAILSAMVGDSGAGGTKGLVPAPAAGDAAASKFLKADGTWAAASGGSLDITGLTAADPALGDESPIYDISAAANRKITLDKLGFLLTGMVGGRLTLTTGLSVTTADVTAAGTLYYAIHTHDKIALYDGTRWKMYTFTERSLSLTLTSGKNYDVFLYDNAGTLTLELSSAWTNDTTRADALTTQDGVYVKSGATTRRYLGTIRASATNQTEDSAAKRFVWNMYNRVERFMFAKDTTGSWTYSTSGTWRQANANAANQVELVIGLSTLVQVTAHGTSYSPSTGTLASVGVGVSSTSVNSAQLGGMYPTPTAIPSHTATYMGYPGIGYYYLAWLEVQDSGSYTVTFYGQTAISSSFRNGIMARFRA